MNNYTSQIIIKFSLPWPDRALSPNARGLWFTKEKPRQAAIKTGWVLASEAGAQRYKFQEGVKLGMVCHLHPPDARRRDLDNVLASLKYYLDGVFHALGVDDSCLRSLTLHWDMIIKSGSVELEVYILEPLE